MGRGEASGPVLFGSHGLVSCAPEPPASPKPGDRWVNPRDDGEMVYVAPGEVLMGTDADGAPADERPAFRARLARGFWTDVGYATKSAYAKFCQETGRQVPPPPEGSWEVPVIHVTWYDAAAYAKWAVERLPTELEWRRALSEEAFAKEPEYFEWCAEWYDDRAYKRYAAGSLRPPARGTERLLKGEPWSYIGESGVVHHRLGLSPSRRDMFTSIRCVRDAK